MQCQAVSCNTTQYNAEQYFFPEVKRSENSWRNAYLACDKSFPDHVSGEKRNCTIFSVWTREQTWGGWVFLTFLQDIFLEDICPSCRVGVGDLEGFFRAGSSGRGCWPSAPPSTSQSSLLHSSRPQSSDHPPYSAEISREKSKESNNKILDIKF